MRIAIIGSRGIPPRYSGIESSVDQTARLLGERGHEITVYCRGRRYNNINKDIYKNVRLIFIPTLDSKHFGTFFHVFLSTIHVIFSNAQIVHYHALGPSIFSFLPRLCGKKTAVTVQGLDWKRKKWKYLARVFLKLCEFPAVFFPHRTVVVSKALQDYFFNKYGQKACYIPNGVGICHEEAEQSGPAPKRSYILYAGRLVPEKGVHYLIKAFREIETDMKLVIVGAVDLRDGYTLKLRSISSGNVDFRGFVEPKKMGRFYNDAYVFILPSEVEGTSVSLLEAMSYGKCPIVSDIPESLEVIGDCGIAFRKSDYLDLKEKLRYVINHPEVVFQLGKKAKQRVDEKYNWENIIDGLEDLYLSALS